MPDQTPPPTPDKFRRYAWGLLAASAFMFISIIVKTALKGP